MKKIVILGGGYSGVNAAITLEKKLKVPRDFEIVVINKDVNHVMLTSLHEVAGGRVNAESVQFPLKKIFRSGKVKLLIDEVVNVDFKQRELTLKNSASLKYDYLMIGTGSKPSYFNIEGAKEHSLPLWSLQDALKVRGHIVDSFQAASRINDADQRKKKLSFLIAGGGFTGVELAGEIGEWKENLCRHYRIDKNEVTIKLIEALPTILVHLDSALVSKAVARLNQLGVEVLTDSKILKVDEEYVYLSGESKLAGKLVWCAGIEGNTLNEKLNTERTNQFRLKVDDFMRSVSYEEVYCIGDTVSFEYNGKAVPQIVETALQTSSIAANNILADLYNREKSKFAPDYHGSMVSLGNRFGVAKIASFILSGKLAILMKHLVNIHYFLGLRNPSFVKKYMKYQFAAKCYRHLT